MSNSIFHVRPLDSGKGWAIDEYDGGACVGATGAHGHRRDHRPAVLDLPQPARFGCAACVRIESGENMGLEAVL